MKRGFILLSIIFLLSSQFVDAFSFSDFMDQARNIWEQLYDFVTGQPIKGGKGGDGGPGGDVGGTQERSGQIGGVIDTGDGGGGDDDPQPCPISGCNVFWEQFFYNIGGNDIEIMAVPWIKNQLNFCEDGTLYNECSISAPNFCKNGNLISDCNLCGCAPGYGDCREDGTCEVVDNCEDAGGICDTSCSNHFEHVPKLDYSCNSVRIGEDARPIITISGAAISEKAKCCVPAKHANLVNGTYRKWVEDEWLNISAKRKITKIGMLKDLCVDQSEYEECSSIKPLYCHESHLYNFCSKCGCDEGEVCNIFTNTCVDATTAKKKVMFSKLSQLNEGEESIMADLLYDVYENDVPPSEITAVRIGDRIRITVGNVILYAGYDSGGRPNINFEFPSSFSGTSRLKGDKIDGISKETIIPSETTLKSAKKPIPWLTLTIFVVFAIMIVIVRITAKRKAKDKV